VSNITGEGIVARVDGQDVRIVSPGHMTRQGKPIVHETASARLEGQGKTVVVLVRDGTPRALSRAGRHRAA
jgi:P-type Cu2+ transporter